MSVLRPVCDSDTDGKDLTPVQAAKGRGDLAGRSRVSLSAAGPIPPNATQKTKLAGAFA